MVSLTCSTYNPEKPYTVLMGNMSRAIVYAMLCKDKKALNDLLVQHVNSYRKQPLDYSTFIDAYSIAYIKLAHQYSMDCDLDIIEVPKMFFDEEACRINTEKAKLPFFDSAVEQLRKQGFDWY